MTLVRIAAIAFVGAVIAGACTAHDAETERVGGGPLPVSDGSAACIDEGCEGAPTDGVTWCQALAVIQLKCQPCHSDPPKNDAPFPLVSFESTRRCYNDQLVHERMHSAVRSGAMPFVELNEILGLDPPVEDLTPDEKALLLSWFEQGACDVGGVSCPPN